nr:photosystem I reaction center subunit XII [Prochlorococcus marinus]
MESSQEIIFIALGLLIVIFAGTLALRLGIGLKN